MTPGAHFHVIDNWCGFDGGENYGALPTMAEAEAAVAAQREDGRKGGCRHDGSGWLVRPCFNDDCRDYDNRPLVFPD